jgi:hypothetical protein
MRRTGASLSTSCALILAMLGLSACTTVRESRPQRTATEQLLVSTAVDRAVERMNLKIPVGTRTYVDAGQLEGGDGEYAAAVIRERLLRGGVNLVGERGQADLIVEARTGAMSIDDRNTLVGIGSFNAPIPFAGEAFRIPEIALYREKERLGVAKIAAVGYRTSDGMLIDFTGPQFGYSHENEWLVLFFFTWRSTDLPQEEEGDLFGFR